MHKKILIVAAILLAAPVFAQQQNATLSPSDSQHRKLTSAREKISKLQTKIADLQIEFNFLAAKFHDTCRQIAMENHWPEATQCDPNSLLFYQQPSAPQVANASPQQKAAAEYAAQEKKSEEAKKP